MYKRDDCDRSREVETGGRVEVVIIAEVKRVLFNFRVRRYFWKLIF